MSLSQSWMRTALEEMFVALRRQGQGLTLDQEDVIWATMGMPRYPTPLVRKGIGVNDTLSPSAPAPAAPAAPLPAKAGDTLSFPSPIAEDTEMLEAPRIDITQTDEYKAMLKARQERGS